MPRRNRRTKLKQLEEEEISWRKVETNPLNPPRGWSYGYCLDNGRVYFIRLNRSRVLESLPKERRRKIRREWGELEVKSQLIDYKKHVIYLPPQVRRPEMPCFRFARVERWGPFLVYFGGELVEC